VIRTGGVLLLRKGYSAAVVPSPFGTTGRLSEEAAMLSDEARKVAGGVPCMVTRQRTVCRSTS
jgi:hypothetical protein